MGRPKTPLITRSRALAAALEVIDNEGIDALSVRRLAVELGVNGASLYHHFENKDAIITGAAELALAEVKTPKDTGDGWKSWLPENARRTRDVLVRHPQLVPIVARRSELGLGRRELEASARRLVSEGVPLGAVMPLLDAMETIALGSALHEISVDPEQVVESQGSDTQQDSVLSRAIAMRGLAADEIFDIVTRSIVEAIDMAVHEQVTRWLPSAVEKLDA